MFLLDFSSALKVPSQPCKQRLDEKKKKEKKSKRKTQGPLTNLETHCAVLREAHEILSENTLNRLRFSYFRYAFSQPLRRRVKTVLLHQTA